jgi:hypothetical protein
MFDAFKGEIAKTQSAIDDAKKVLEPKVERAPLKGAL